MTITMKLRLALIAIRAMEQAVLQPEQMLRTTRKHLIQQQLVFIQLC